MMMIKTKLLNMKEKDSLEIEKDQNKLDSPTVLFCGGQLNLLYLKQMKREEVIPLQLHTHISRSKVPSPFYY